MTSHTPQAPLGYVYHKTLGEEINAKRKRPFWLIIIAANFIALIPLTLGVAGLWLPYQFYKVIGAPYAIYPADVPLGFRLKSSGITLAAALDQVTYLSPNDDLPSGFFGV